MTDEGKRLSERVLEIIEDAPGESMRAKLSYLFALMIAGSDENMKPDPRNAMFGFADAATALWGVLGVEVQVRVEAGRTHVFRAGETTPREYVVDVEGGGDDPQPPTIN